MADLTELERRVTALEVELRNGRHDAQRLLMVQEATLSQVETLNRRVTALEFAVDAGADAVACGFAETRERFKEMAEQMSDMKDRFDAQFCALEAKIDDLPRMLAEMLNEEPPSE